MGKSYTMTIAGLTRELPLCPISDKLDIAAFVIFGDVPLTVAAAEALLKKANAQVLANHLDTCVKESIENQGDYEQKLEEIEQLIHKLVR